MSGIIDKVRKLLDLSRNNPSPEEATQAAARAQELMFKYQIGEADLDASETKSTPEAVGEISIDGQGGQAKGARAVWKSSLAQAVASSMGCKMYFCADAFRIYGLKSATQAVSYIYQYLVLEIEQLCTKGWELHAGGMAPEYRTRLAVKWKNSFRSGAVDVVSHRLYQQRKQQKKHAAELPQSQALVLYKSDEERVSEGWGRREKELHLRTARSSVRLEPSAFERGQAAGRNISLGGGKELGGGKQRIGGSK